MSKIVSSVSVQSGAVLSATGSGQINATEINGVPLPSTNSGIAGKIPITDGAGNAAWSDPFVQGVYAPGQNVTTGGIAGGPINPVLIGGSDGTSLRNLKVDSSGNIYIGNTSLAVTGTFYPSTQPVSLASSVAVTGTFWQTTQPISGTVTAAQSTAASLNATVVFPAAQHVIVDSGSINTDVGAASTMLTTLASVSFSSSGTNTLVAGVTSQTIRVMRLLLTNNGSNTNITFQDSTPTSFSGAMLLSSGGTLYLPNEGEPHFLTASGKGFVLNSSAATQISGVIWFTQS
jgi:hypothetical protein